MSGAPCWFCEDANAQRTVDEILHHPKTLAEETVSAGACLRCYKLARSISWIMIAVLGGVLLIGVIVAWIVADVVMPQRGPSGVRGKAMALVFWPIVGGFLVLDVIVAVVLRRTLRAMFHLHHIDLIDHPRTVALRQQGYKWGKAPATSAVSK